MAEKDPYGAIFLARGALKRIEAEAEQRGWNAALEALEQTGEAHEGSMTEIRGAFQVAVETLRSQQRGGGEGG